jgi:hypothetical protein
MSPLTNPTLATPDDKPPRCRSWLPSSLRLFVAILAFLGLGSGLWIGIPVYRQQVTIRHFRELGIEIVPDASRVVPDWLYRWIDARRLEPLGIVKDADFSGCGLTDSDVAYLKGLKGLEWLALNRNSITDAGMRHLAAIGTLRALRLEDTEVTDAGLVHLKGLVRLEVLSLKRTGVTGSGFKHLTELPLLRHLNLDGSLVDDTAVVDLKGLICLRELRLRDTLISEDGLAPLRGLIKLEHLQLGDLKVSPTAVADLETAIPGLDVSYEWNYTLRNTNGEPALDTDWIKVVFEGGKFTSEMSGTFPISGHFATSSKATFYMGGLRNDPPYSAEMSWAYKYGLLVVDFIATSRDNRSTKMMWRAQFTDCGRTLICRGRTIRLPKDFATVVICLDGSVRIDGWPVQQDSTGDE